MRLLGENVRPPLPTWTICTPSADAAEEVVDAAAAEVVVESEPPPPY